MRAWLLFSALRVLVFAVPFAILYALGLEWWLAALIAAVVGFCLSYIFLRPLRDRVASQLAEARSAAPKPTDDEAAEDTAPGS
ncbi:DUF4229 domain-containing protein [Pseudolysinimonas sp.]|uniref:DUF4229 domain-containing protein n=1 Tax=Pseudolysinimonas sp. TaxID=2680009 RepID=UPI00286C63BC|nr:DUF4229 domain-containing protein [Pseudolysinimonas sp.]